jgi:23S rRNA (adenine2503-C2)-methyltransferase
MSHSAHARHFAPPPATTGGRRELIGLSRADLAAEIAALGEPAFRAQQLWHWLYHRGATDFAAMTSLSKAFRSRLAEHFTAGRPEIATAAVSGDGTRKWLLRFPDGQEVESVHIPEEDRGTLCVSSQVGCTFAIPGRSASCAISRPPRSSGRSCWYAMHSASGRRRMRAGASPTWS